MKTTFTAMGSNGVELHLEVEPEGLTVSIAGSEEVTLDGSALAGLEEFLNSSMRPRPQA